MTRTSKVVTVASRLQLLAALVFIDVGRRGAVPLIEMLAGAVILVLALIIAHVASDL